MSQFRELDCEEFHRLLTSGTDQEWNDLREAMDQHVESCPSCEFVVSQEADQVIEELSPGEFSKKEE